MAVATASAIIAGVGLVVGTALQIKQARAQADAADEQKKQARVEAQRRRRATLREARIKQAQSINAASAQGVGQSSGLAGGVASASSQAGTEIGYVNSIELSNRRAAKAQAKADLYGGAAGIVGGISSFGQDVFNKDF